MKKIQNLFFKFFLVIFFTIDQIYAVADRTTKKIIVNIHNMSDTPVRFWFWGSLEGVKDNPELWSMVDVNQTTQLTIPAGFKIQNIGCRRFIDKEGKFPLEWEAKFGWQMDFSIDNMYINDDIPADVFVYGSAKVDKNNNPTIPFNGTTTDAQGKITPAIWLACWKPIDLSRFKSAEEAMTNDDVKKALKIFYQDATRINPTAKGDENNRVFLAV